MVHQYPNQEVVDGTAALAGVSIMSAADENQQNANTARESRS